MADARSFFIEPQLDFGEILRDAKTRWLRPREICEILRNYTRFNLTPDPPFRPPGGTLFLFDRKSLRYFRKDGHNWRKKKDGKTVREAHEKLKFGSVDVLHCYYAHGEDNENFQRRSYWLLDGQMGNIVLVHYRDVNEGSSSSIPQVLDKNIAACSNPSSFHIQTAYASNNVQDWSHQAHYSEYDDVDSGEDVETSLAESMSYSGAEAASSGDCTFQENTTGHDSLSYLNARSSLDSGITSRFFDPTFPDQRPLQNLLSGNVQQLCGISQVAVDSLSTYKHHLMESKLTELPSVRNSSSEVMQEKVSLEQPSRSDGTSKMTTTFLDGHGVSAGDDNKEYQVKDENHIGNSDFYNHNNLVNESTDAYQLCPPQYLAREPRLKNNSTSKLGNVAASTTLDYKTQASDVLNMPFNSNVSDDKNGDLKRLDSFGMWMHTEIGKDCYDSLMASDSANIWNSIDSQAKDQEVSSPSGHMQDMGSLGPSISQEQLFTIHDFSPDWAYSNVETKVLIVGAFLGRVEPRSIKWSCMFGELEVSAEVLTTNVLRCQAPMHTLGRVPFYVTCSNRIACSEIREFEYRGNISSSLVLTKEPQMELYLQVRLSKLLSTGIDKKKMMCSGENCQKCMLKQKIFPLLMVSQNEWEKINNDLEKMKNELIQKLLKGRMYEWLVCKAHEEGKGPNTLDEKGQGAIHLAAALGYEWAMAPIVSAGVSPSFRDSRGWTGLHWAAYFGREETVAELVKLGAAPGAVEDPTSKFPQGQTAADVASSRGHKGIAGYLAEADLTSHLSSLTIKDSIMDSVSADIAAERAVETVHEQNAIALLNGEMAEQSLRESLTAVRNSAQAAARIQAAFRAHSFRRRQLSETKDEGTHTFDDMMVVSSVSRFHRINHFNQSLHTAAVKIQQKYRGWKGRKEFLKIRDRIVKLQAHVRGHQVRKQYKKVIWSVGIVEKAILRWRRKGAGLRGFRALNTVMFDERKVETSDEYDFLRVGRLQKVAGVEKALARVKSMARNPEARDQYMRLVASSRRSKLGYEESSPVQGQNTEEEYKAGDLDQLTKS